MEDPKEPGQMNFLLQASLNIRRKVFHILLGSFIVLWVRLGIVPYGMTLLLLAAALLAGLALSYASLKADIPLVRVLLDVFEKKEHIDTFPGKGAFFFVAGAMFSLLLFGEDIGCAAIMVLTFGDPAAFAIGRYYGRTRMCLSKTKLLEGSIGGALVGCTFALLFVSPIEAYIGAAFAMAVESVELDFWSIDDNFSIPVVAGLTAYVLRALII